MYVEVLREMRTFNLNSALSSPEKSAGVELKAETPSGEGSPIGEPPQWLLVSPEFERNGQPFTKFRRQYNHEA